MFLVILLKLFPELPTSQSPLSHTRMNMNRSLSWKHFPVWKVGPGQASRISKQAVLETGTFLSALAENPGCRETCIQILILFLNHFLLCFSTFYFLSFFLMFFFMLLLFIFSFPFIFFLCSLTLFFIYLIFFSFVFHHFLLLSLVSWLYI